MHAYVVVDLGFGDQGKGTMTDFLVRDLGAGLVVRHNGGAQAAHRVVTDDGRRHTFAQLGSGSFVPGVRTFLSRHVAISPWSLLVEAEHLARQGVADALARTFIAAGAAVITPFHRAANRLRERARGAARHGSCGVGVGETVADARTLPASEVVRAGDLVARDLRARLLRVQARKREELAPVVATLDDPGQRAAAAAEIDLLSDPGWVDAWLGALGPLAGQVRIVPDEALGDLLSATSVCVFEGAQGVLLDEDHGFHPYTTWGSCTSRNALALLDEAGFAGEVTRLGVLRAYATRHGPGPLPTESRALTAALPEPCDFDAPAEATNWQGPFRCGWFDAVSARYAIDANGGIDALAVTCLDRVEALPTWRAASAYTIDGERRERITLTRPGDLSAQAELGEALTRARPEYLELKVSDALAVIDREVHPVALASRGPTASAKTWLAEPR